jgi:hypothetical protein
VLHRAGAVERLFEKSTEPVAIPGPKGMAAKMPPMPKVPTIFAKGARNVNS